MHGIQVFGSWQSSLLLTADMAFSQLFIIIIIIN